MYFAPPAPPIVGPLLAAAPPPHEQGTYTRNFVEVQEIPGILESQLIICVSDAQICRRLV
jgi:hypothetical protein